MSAQFSPEPSERAKQPLAHHRAQASFFHSHQDGRSAPFLQLQRALGNRRVAELIQAKRLTHEGRIMDCRMSRIQPKLTVGAADQYEQEADRVSRQVGWGCELGICYCSIQPLLGRTGCTGPSSCSCGRGERGRSRGNREGWVQVLVGPELRGQGL